ncbi:hypothetical protein chiPu_0003133 [Chiloscyllium punctatum]|uniref:Cell growth-regulating nucleolar protein n=1 Tax=Chiloscyllium punctatum TaxID=137246 RepID=A0A401S2W1_CHIPU|nr:hypothetical protein [Chiloscyllium punctatum]
MVVFICNGCGASVKKAQVEKHFNSCRNCPCLSCIDCGKDFWGEDYKTHIKCISEDEKYGGKGFEAKAKKGDLKQQQWIETVHQIMNESNVNPKVREILEQMNSYDNIPRKKAKFQNWMKNSLQIYSEALQGQVWEIFAAALSKDKAKQQENDTPNGVTPSKSVEADQNQAPAGKSEEKGRNKQEAKAKGQKKSKKEKKLLNSEECKSPLKHETDSKTKEQNKTLKGKKKKLKKLHKKDGAHTVRENGNQAEGCEQQNSENVLGRKKGKKRKQKTSNEGEPNSKREKVQVPETKEVEEANKVKQGKFNWKRAIKIVLKQSPEQEISVKKLRKKVLSQYYAECGDSNYKSEVELLAIFYKKISSNPKFKVLKDKVKLVK